MKSALHNILLGHLHQKQKICWLMRFSHTVQSLSVCVCVCTCACVCACVPNKARGSLRLGPVVSCGNFNFNCIRSELFFSLPSLDLHLGWCIQTHSYFLLSGKSGPKFLFSASPNCFCSHWVLLQLLKTQSLNFQGRCATAQVESRP